MSSGTDTLTGGGASAAILAADEYRDYVLIQVQSDHDVYFGFDEDAVTLTGIALLEPGATIAVRGPKARGAINALSTGNAVLGWETKEEITHTPGQFAGPWPAS